MSRSCILIMLLAAAACTNDPPALVVPPNDAGTIDARADAGDLPFPLNSTCAPVTVADACSSCTQSHCCDVRTTVLATPNYQDLSNCLSPPDGGTCDANCEQACFAQYPGATQPVLDYGVCRGHYCGVECEDYTKPTCDACIVAKCTSEDVACHRSKECFVLEDCVQACGRDGACIEACTKTYPGAALLSPLTTCILTQCAKECPKE